MARPLRLQFPNAVYHIVARGNEKAAIYKDDKDRLYHISLIKEWHTSYNIVIYAYCLMPNHYHLLVETPDANISKAMHWLQSSYTTWYNIRHKRVGHLFQGRYKSILVQKDNYLLGLSRYIHLNPVKHGLVKRPADYPWSSYATYISKRKMNSEHWLNVNFILSQFSQNKVKAIYEYKRFVESDMERALNTQPNLTAGFILGDEKFVEKIQEMISDQEEKLDVPEVKKARKTLEIATIIDAVKNYYGIVGNEWLSTKYQKKKDFGRDAVIFLAKRYTNLNFRELAKKFGNLSGTHIGRIDRKVVSEMESNSGFKKQIWEIKKMLDVRPDP